MNIYNLRDELSNQKVTNQPCMVKGKNDLYGTFAQIIMHLKDFDAFGNFLEFIDKHFGEGSVIIGEAHNFIEKDEKNFLRFKKKRLRLGI